MWASPQDCLSVITARGLASPRNMPLAKKLLHPSPEEKRKHKKKCLV
ncbi:hypothetical protein Cadr_000014896 [Camelus dromedarius]|uniref:Uncharacterized protein n=1 Tax=Camelus dromedarius TaxID=9838 RepID=A0A5N4DPD3_CAMDR|nr:hypothetical protein Cadr_000014896 [Camelus dromedarius]